MMGRRAKCIDGINPTIYYYKNSHSHMIKSHDWLVQPTPTSPTKRKRMEPSPTPELHENSSATPSNLLQVQRHSPATCIPTRGSPHAVGYNLYSVEATRVPARGRTLVNIQISIVVPQDTYGRVAPRSGLASRCTIDVGAGVIDPNYCRVVFILLLNHNNHNFEVNVGDRIAQLVLERISTLAVVKVLDFDTMPSSPNTPFLETADFERSPLFEIEDTTSQRTSPSPPAPRVQLLVNQVIGDRNPCPETWTPTKKELQKARSPAPRPSIPTSSHPRFTSPVPRPLGIPLPPLASTSTGHR